MRTKATLISEDMRILHTTPGKQQWSLSAYIQLAEQKKLPGI